MIELSLLKVIMKIKSIVYFFDVFIKHTLSILSHLRSFLFYHELRILSRRLLMYTLSIRSVWIKIPSTRRLPQSLASGAASHCQKITLIVSSIWTLHYFLHETEIPVRSSRSWTSKLLLLNDSILHFQFLLVHPFERTVCVAFLFLIKFITPITALILIW